MQPCTILPVMTTPAALPKGSFRVGFRAEREPDGIVKAVVSELGKVGRDGIIIAPGAVGDQQVVLSSWMHNATSWSSPKEPVGDGAVRETGDEGAEKLLLEGRYWMDDPEGERAWKIVERLDWLDWSITFVSEEPPEVRYNEEIDDITILYRKLRVFESSPVTLGGSFGTGTEELRQAARDARTTELDAARAELEKRDQGLRDAIQASEDWALLDKVFKGEAA